MYWVQEQRLRASLLLQGRQTALREDSKGSHRPFLALAYTDCMSLPGFLEFQGPCSRRFRRGDPTRSLHSAEETRSGPSGSSNFQVRTPPTPGLIYPILSLSRCLWICHQELCSVYWVQKQRLRASLLLQGRQTALREDSKGSHRPFLALAYTDCMSLPGFLEFQGPCSRRFRRGDPTRSLHSVEETRSGPFGSSNFQVRTPPTPGLIYPILSLSRCLWICHQELCSVYWVQEQRLRASLLLQGRQTALREDSKGSHRPFLALAYTDCMSLPGFLEFQGPCSRRFRRGDPTRSLHSVEETRSGPSGSSNFQVRTPPTPGLIYPILSLSRCLWICHQELCSVYWVQEQRLRASLLLQGRQTALREDSKGSHRPFLALAYTDCMSLPGLWAPESRNGLLPGCEGPHDMS